MLMSSQHVTAGPRCQQSVSRPAPAHISDFSHGSRAGQLDCYYSKIRHQLNSLGVRQLLLIELDS